jgi:hypothetical protein
MHTQSQDDAHLDKWRESTAREKAEVIAAFLNEYGEHANWEDWRTFLHKRQAKGFEWTNSAN